MKVSTQEALEKITKFLERWYPPEIAPHVVSTQVRMLGIDVSELTEKDIKFLLSRLETVVLPTYMDESDAKLEIRKIKRELGISY